MLTLVRRQRRRRMRPERLRPRDHDVLLAGLLLASRTASSTLLAKVNVSWWGQSAGGWWVTTTIETPEGWHSYEVCAEIFPAPARSHATTKPNRKPPTCAKKATPPPLALALNSPKFASTSW